MKKRIFIVNGMARSGKDTFANFLDDFVPVFKYSSIDKVKCIAAQCGWDGGKTERDRKFLSDLKMLTTEYSDMPFVDVSIMVDRFRLDDTRDVMLIDIREPEEIEKAKKAFDAETIYIHNPNVMEIVSNFGDAHVSEYHYDHVVRNIGTLTEFREVVKQFAETVILNNEKETKNHE